MDIGLFIIKLCFYEGRVSGADTSVAQDDDDDDQLVCE